MPVQQARMREMASQALSPLPLGPNNTKSNAFDDIEERSVLNKFTQRTTQVLEWSGGSLEKQSYLSGLPSTFRTTCSSMWTYSV
ncbi:hypothetical protein N7535_003193 [Penicillium sp. DV-2018c]|nr:hypothetical protein N7461_001116 [Penicillium sp. DV-2018c]KAJ5576267.1 hypothetical protein N7535_003193 [Penicillium sp. DV-2018c]